MLEDVVCNIKRSKRKTISIYVERDGTVSVLAPKDLSDDKLTKLVKSKEYLIYKHLSEWEDLNRSRVEREYVNGQSFLYMGRNYRLELVEEQEVPLKLKNGYFLLRKKDKLAAKSHFIQFYKTKSLPHLTQKVNHFKNKMDVNPNRIRVQELQHRWASCSGKGNLHFHWKCAMAPGSVMSYIVVHELAHLKHLNHSPAFWNEVDKVMPNYQKYVEWLRANGAGMEV